MPCSVTSRRVALLARVTFSWETHCRYLPRRLGQNNSRWSVWLLYVQSYGSGSPRQVPDYYGGSQSHGSADVFVPEPSRLAPVRTRRTGAAAR